MLVFAFSGFIKIYVISVLKKVTSRLVALFVLVIMLSACEQDRSPEMAADTLSGFISAIKNKDFDKAIDYYDDHFFDLMPREVWLARLQEVNEKLGELERVQVGDERVNTTFYGKRFIYMLHTTYSNGPATETLVLEQEPPPSDQVRIVSHKIESSKLSPM